MDDEVEAGLTLTGTADARRLLLGASARGVSVYEVAGGAVPWLTNVRVISTKDRLTIRGFLQWEENPPSKIKALLLDAAGAPMETHELEVTSCSGELGYNLERDGVGRVVVDWRIYIAESGLAAVDTWVAEEPPAQGEPRDREALLGEGAASASVQLRALLEQHDAPLMAHTDSDTVVVGCRPVPEGAVFDRVDVWAPSLDPGSISGRVSCIEAFRQATGGEPWLEALVLNEQGATWSHELTPLKAGLHYSTFVVPLHIAPSAVILGLVSDQHPGVAALRSRDGANNRQGVLVRLYLTLAQSKRAGATLTLTRTVFEAQVPRAGDQISIFLVAEPITVDRVVWQDSLGTAKVYLSAVTSSPLDFLREALTSSELNSRWDDWHQL